MAKIKADTRSRIRVVTGITTFILLSSLLFIPTNPGTAADEVKWSRVTVPTEGKAGNWLLADGSDIQHLTMAADGTLYACVTGLTYTLYSSTNDGYSWSQVGNVQDNIVGITTSPADPNIIYYATTSGVYRSADSGKTFIRLPANPGGAGSNNIEITSISVTPTDGNIIAVGTRDTDTAQFGGIYTLEEEPFISQWVDTGLAGYDIYAVAFSPSFPTDRQLVAVVTDETDTLVTTKSGNFNWGETTGNARLDRDNSGTPTPVVVTNSAVIAFTNDYEAYDAPGKSVLFVAIDTGSGNGDVYRINSRDTPDNSITTDLNIGNADGQNNTDVTGLAVHGSAASASLLAGAADNARTFFSTDRGGTWERSYKELTGGSKTCVLMAPDFSSSSKAYAATGGSESAFSISWDNATTWNQVGLIDTGISAIVDFAPSPEYSQDNTLFLLTFGGKHSLWRSLDGGDMWERIFSSNPDNVDSLALMELSPQYGSGSQVVFLNGSSNGNPSIWKSTDNGNTFTSRFAVSPTTGSAINISTWAIADDNTLFIGSYNGSDGLVYRTTNGGLTYSKGVPAGSQTMNSIVLSPHFEQDGTILLGNTNGWVYWSSDNCSSFEPLPPDATTSPLAGSITVAFDSGFENNKTVYAASDTADKGIYRFTIGTDTEWESIDSTMPSGGMINRVIVADDGTLYAANTKADGGLERSFNPTYSLGPSFETVTRGLSDGATLSGLWQENRRLWSIDSTNLRLVTFNDSLSSPVILSAPENTAPGIGILTNHTITNVSLNWKTLKGATSYQWQLDSDTDFSTVPSGFEGTTKSSSVLLPALEPATTYYWRVRVTAPVLSKWSAKWSFTTSLDSEVVTLKLENPGAGASDVAVKPLFQWSVVAGADTYELLVSKDVHFNDPSITRAGAYALDTTAWQSDLSLDNETTYYWKVRATSA
ncbi:hypothetical protein ACFLVB_04120, partial [Chloroflexota bacterium]